MNLLKNKHLIAAMFVAPVLAIIAYFAVDHVVSEKPHTLQQGKSYQLAARPNCRYQSGECTLENGDVEVSVRVQRLSDTEIQLVLSSSLPAQNVLAALYDGDRGEEPVVMRRDQAETDIWTASFALVDPAKSQLRLVLDLAGAVFFAETPAVFIDYDTTYSRDNFSPAGSMQ